MTRTGRGDSWHSAVCTAAKPTLRDNALESDTKVGPSRKPLQVDLVVIRKKDAGRLISSPVGRIFTRHNLFASMKCVTDWPRNIAVTVGAV